MHNLVCSYSIFEGTNIPGSIILNSLLLDDMCSQQRKTEYQKGEHIVVSVYPEVFKKITVYTLLVQEPCERINAVLEITKLSNYRGSKV